jgi:hypothetical protein
VALSLFEPMPEFEICRMRELPDLKVLIELGSQLSRFRGFTHSFNEIALILQQIREIEKIPDLTPDFMSILQKLKGLIVPVGLVLRVISAMNDFIKEAELARKLDFLAIEFPNFAKRLFLGWYERTIFRKVGSGQLFDNAVAELCQAIEDSGVHIIREDGCVFNIAQIIAPNITDPLRRLQVLLNGMDVIEEVKQIAADLTQKPMTGNSFFGVEQEIAQLGPGNDEVLDILKQIRRIHHLFLALDGRKMISYSNSVSLMYFRTFVASICEQDMFGGSISCATNRFTGDDFH